MPNGNMKKIIFDIDDTLLYTTGFDNKYKLVDFNEPLIDWMREANKEEDIYVFEAFTARGSKSGFDF